MANWKYTINLKNVWDKYKKYSHEDYDTDKKLFTSMKKEMLANLVKEADKNDWMMLCLNGTVEKLKRAKHLSSWNNAWGALYDYCDYHKIWLSTNF